MRHHPNSHPKVGDKTKLGHANIWNKNVGNAANQPLLNWRNAVFNRDKHTCQHPNCKTPRRKIKVCRIDGNGQKYQLSNGITLCYCHASSRYKHVDLYLGIVRGGQGINLFDLKLRMLDNGTAIHDSA